MTEKNRPNDTNTAFLSNELIDENYGNLVLDKITKELIEINGSKCCDNCEEAVQTPSNNLENDRKLNYR